MRGIRHSIKTYLLSLHVYVLDKRLGCYRRTRSSFVSDRYLIKFTSCSNSYSGILDLCTYQFKAGGGGGRAWGGDLTFSKICRQIPCPWANHSSQMHKNFPTPGGILLSIIPWLDARKTQGKQENSIIFTSQRYYISKGTI